MSEKNAIPESWYKYDWPLSNSGPTPSKADYSPQNVAWLIEFFADMLDGYSHRELTLNYENNTPEHRGDDIFVEHPNDKLYLPEKGECKSKSLDMVRYESFAKQSSILKLFEENSPADISYFQDSCE